MNEFHSSFFLLGAGQRGVGWSMNSYRLFLLPFFHLTIQIHGDRKWRGAQGGEATGVRGQEWLPFEWKLLISTGDNILSPKVTVQVLGCQKPQSKRRECEKRGKDQRGEGGMQTLGSVNMICSVFEERVWWLHGSHYACICLCIFLKGGPGIYCAACTQITAFLPCGRQLYLKPFN